MFITNIACNLLDGLRQQQQRAGHEAFVLLNAFDVNVTELTEEEVDDEPPQPRSSRLAFSQPH